MLSTLKRFSNGTEIFWTLVGIFILSSLLLVGCHDDDEKEAWEHEVNSLKTAMDPNEALDQAIDAGYDNEFTGYRTMMGYHYLKGSLLDDNFEIEKPEVMMFAPDENGDLKFVGVEYAVPIADLNNPPPAPEGFTGSKDVWAINTEFSVWTLHVWIGKTNPDGIFEPHNPDLP